MKQEKLKDLVERYVYCKFNEARGHEEPDFVEDLEFEYEEYEGFKNVSHLIKLISSECDKELETLGVTVENKLEEIINKTFKKLSKIRR